MLKQNDIMQIVDLCYDYGKKLLQTWHDHKMDQIRLQTANIRRIEEYKHQCIIDQIKYKSKRKAGVWKNKDGNTQQAE